MPDAQEENIPASRAISKVMTIVKASGTGLMKSPANKLSSMVAKTSTPG